MSYKNYTKYERSDDIYVQYYVSQFWIIIYEDPFMYICFN